MPANSRWDLIRVLKGQIYHISYHIYIYHTISYATDDTLVRRMRCACHTTKAAMVTVPHRSIVRCMSVLVDATMATS